MIDIELKLSKDPLGTLSLIVASLFMESFEEIATTV